MKSCTHCGRAFEGEGELCPRCALIVPVTHEEPRETSGAEGAAQSAEAEPEEAERAVQTLSRRRFLTASVLSMGGVMGLGYLGLAVRYLLPGGSAATQTFQDVGPVSSFAPMAPVLKVVQEGGTEDGVFVTNLGSSFLALDFHCTHLNCPVNWYPGVNGVGRYICPCHGSQFTITGQHVAGPAPRPMWRHQVMVKDGHVWVGGIIL